MRETIIIGYSGHGYVAYEILQSQNHLLIGYCEEEEKKFNPYQLVYYGRKMSKSGLSKLRNANYFISVGSNRRRQIIHETLTKIIHEPIMAIYSKSVISPSATIHSGVMIGANVVVNALAKIGTGAICNSSCIIEHECEIGKFAHIAPGATLAGNVKIGERSFIGANAVVKQGVSIGNDVIVGAGTVVIKDIPDGTTVVGNPQKIIKKI